MNPSRFFDTHGLMPPEAAKLIRILVVDDSAFMRKALSMMLESDPEIRVVDTARDGQEAVEKAARLKPDVITMDVEMPRMDGITALKLIMKESPCAVLMISSLTREGAQATMEALNAGAVDFIPKQMSYVSLEIARVKEDLTSKIKSIMASRSRRLLRRTESQAGRPAPRAARPPQLRFTGARAIAIGVSTGGPFALQKVIPALPKDLPVPVLVVQHMPPHFTRTLAERLNTLSTLAVQEVEAGMTLQSGNVYIARGGAHMVFRNRGAQVEILTPESPTTLHRPSVDVMLQSANDVFGGRILTCIMTGMGKDGLEGSRAIHGRGGKIIAQDEDTCVVYGMPRAVAEAGLIESAYPLEDIAGALAGAVLPARKPAL